MHDQSRFKTCFY